MLDSIRKLFTLALFDPALSKSLEPLREDLRKFFKTPYVAEYEEGFVYARAEDQIAFAKSATRKLGKFLSLRRLDPNDPKDCYHIEEIKYSWRIIYYYKPTAKRVQRYEKKQAIKRELGKGRAVLYSLARRNSYKDFCELQLVQENKKFIEHKFGTLKNFHRICKDPLRFVDPQKKLEEFIK